MGKSTRSNTQKGINVKKITLILLAGVVFITLFYILSQERKNSALEAQTISTQFEKKVSSKEYIPYGEQAKFTQTHNSSEARSGNRSLKIVSSNSDPKKKKLSELTRWMTPIQRIKVQPGSEIYAEAYMKSKNVTEQGELVLSFFSEKGEKTWGDAWIVTSKSNKTISGTKGWTKMSLRFEAPEGSAYVRPEFRLWDKGTIWIDDFTIKIEPQGTLNIKNGNKDIKLMYTNVRDRSKGNYVLLGDKEFIWVNKSCSDLLEKDGNTATKTTWKSLDSSYKQIKASSLTCKQIRAYDAKNPPTVTSNTKNDGGTETTPTSTATTKPAAGTVEGAIAYEGPNQYNWSVIPIDKKITTSLHGKDSGRGQQLFTVDCKSSHFEHDDPIVYPGRADVSHLHEFFGDTKVDADTQTMDILKNSGNTCEVASDRSAYWSPAAYQNGKRVAADNNKIYYKVGNVDPKSIQPMPVGLRMIAGNANAKKPQSKQVAYAFATTGTKKVTEPKTQISSSDPKLFTIKDNENGLRIKILFPQCWDGKYLWLPNTKHMSYAVDGKCPGTHPVPFLQVQMNLGYTNAVGGSGFKLSSGEWYTAHADFINGWHPESLERLTDVCVREKRYCGMTKSNDAGCMSKKNVQANKMGCIELRAGESNPRFFGRKF